MEELLVRSTHYVSLAIEAMALLIVAFGSVEVFVAAGKDVFRGYVIPGSERRVIWMRYARWLVAGLTLQLAADIVDTAIAPGWDEIGKLAAIAAIRTFLNFFLERDMDEVRERQRARGEVASSREQP